MLTIAAAAGPLRRFTSVTIGADWDPSRGRLRRSPQGLADITSRGLFRCRFTTKFLQTATEPDMPDNKSKRGKADRSLGIRPLVGCMNRSQPRSRWWRSSNNGRTAATGLDHLSGDLFKRCVRDEAVSA